MSNNYNSTLQSNNIDLQEILNTINELPEAGGGVDLPTLTNEGSASDLLSGKQLIDQEGNIVEGTITTKTSSNLTANGATVTVPAGYYATEATKSVSTGSAKTPATTITKNPTISVNSSGLITASVSGTQNITPTVTSGYVSSGTAGTITVSGSNTKQLTTQSAKTITPTKSSQTAVAKDIYTTGVVTVAAIPSQYITTTDATAAANEIMSGETAYVNGSKVTGTFSIDNELTAQDSLITQIQNAVNNLPEAGSGSEDLDVELTTQENLISQLSTILDNKASGGSGGGSELQYATGEFTCSSTGATVTGLGFTPKHVVAYFYNGNYSMPAVITQYYFVQDGITSSYIGISGTTKYNSYTTSAMTMLDDGFTINERALGSYAQGTWVYIAFG